VLGVLLTLWVVLDGVEGFERCRPVFEAMEDAVSPRTAKRWLQRALRVATALQQAFRHEVIEKSEPRPVERFFPGGLSPPEGLLRRRWGAARSVVTLWRGLAFLLGGAVQLGVPAALLLAGARGRTSTPTGSWF
jgi:hypothetical protein